MQKRVCTKCRVEKLLSDFYKAGPTQPQTYGGVRMPCKQCACEHRNAYMKKRWREDPEFRERDKQRRRKMRATDPAKFKAREAKFHAGHPGYEATRGRRRYANDPRVRERIKRWVREHPEVRAVCKANRRTRERAAGKLTAAQWRAVLEAYGHKCVYCAARGRLTLEHLVPVCRRGRTDLANVVPACKPCNHRKNRRPLEEFLAERDRVGFLARRGVGLFNLANPFDKRFAMGGGVNVPVSH